MSLKPVRLKSLRSNSKFGPISGELASSSSVKELGSFLSCAKSFHSAKSSSLLREGRKPSCSGCHKEPSCLRNFSKATEPGICLSSGSGSKSLFRLSRHELACSAQHVENSA